jgi:hypothetical protein
VYHIARVCLNEGEDKVEQMPSTVSLKTTMRRTSLLAFQERAADGNFWFHKQGFMRNNPETCSCQKKFVEAPVLGPMTHRLPAVVIALKSQSICEANSLSLTIRIDEIV